MDATYGYPHPGLQTPTIRNVMEASFFLADGEWQERRRAGDYDLVIVGSGFCGYAVAKRAIENDPDCRILMIERGPFFLAEHFQNLSRPFKEVLGIPSETFPWTLSEATATGRAGAVTWAHGMIPFFGGRSTHWSGWCARPEPRELYGWPPSTVDALEEYLDEAEALLGVQRADRIEVVDDADASGRRVYGALQRCLAQRCSDALKINADLQRAEPARLAIGPFREQGRGFAKYSVPVALLGLAAEARQRALRGVGARFDIVTECVVQQLQVKDGSVSALLTSRGSCQLGSAKLILATGSLPPATLLQCSSVALPARANRFSAHFLSSLTARIPRASLGERSDLAGLQMGACQLFGARGGDYRHQFHVQLTAVTGGEWNEARVQRLLPDVKASPSQEQLLGSADHVVLVLTGLGELDCDNPNTWFRRNPRDTDPTTGSELQIDISERDTATWDAMDRALFDIIRAIARGGTPAELWHGQPQQGTWSRVAPRADALRVPCVVHESSTLPLGVDAAAPVGVDYRLRGLENVYVTGGALWPRGGAAGPTLTMVALATHLADGLVRRAQRSMTQMRAATSIESASHLGAVGSR